MFKSKEWRLANAVFDMFHKILKKSETIQYAEGANNEWKYELDTCYIAFNTATRKLIMTPKDSEQQSVTIDCRFDNTDLQKYKYSVFSQLLDFARKKLTKYIEKTTKDNFNMARDMIKKSSTIKRVDPNKYNNRYELDNSAIIDFNTGAGNYVVTITTKDKGTSKTEIRWADAKSLSWEKFYKLLDLVKNKYEKEQARLAEQKTTAQLEAIKRMQYEHEQ